MLDYRLISFISSGIRFLTMWQQQGKMGTVMMKDVHIWNTIRRRTV